MHGVEERPERPARAGRRRLGLGLAVWLAAAGFTPSHALAFCGDTVVEPGEECDDGNASGGDCCSATCFYEAAGAACPDDGEVCTTDLCDGAGACVHAAGNAGAECRADGRVAGLGSVAAGVLELPVAIAAAWFETHECGDGSLIQFYPQGATCTGWHVYNTSPGSAANLKAKVDGIAAGTYTPPAATAGGTTFNLISGTISSAIPDIRDLYNLKKDAGGEWTARALVFDSEGCANFTSSLAIVGFATVRITMDANSTIAGFVDCVATTGSEGLANFGTVVHLDQECDVPETCDGVSPACPADTREPGGTACTADAAICTADVCDGSGACTHLGGNVGTVCRAAAGACDAAETCAGLATCPADEKSTAVCREAAGVCDAPETCDGTADACPADAKTTALCRAVAGVCDVAAETCDGVGNDCPADTFAGAETTCREPAGVCDAAETCDGAAAACPADEFASGTTCREPADVCDAAETCDGAGIHCPADAFAAGSVCRSSAGECDAAESCTGASPACPADAIAPAGSPCGDPAATECTAPDTCDTSGECLENNALPGTQCQDDDLCTKADSCNTDGDCRPGPLPACDDGNPCTDDQCAPETGDCTFEARPAEGCRSAGKSSLTLTTRGDGKARWKWARGEATGCGDLGMPDADTDYDVCIYDGAGEGGYELAAHFALPASELWERNSGCRWAYKDRTGATDGITSVKIAPREDGRASIQLTAEGEAAPLPAAVAPDRFFASDPDVTVQVFGSAGVCWESRLTDARRNTGESYKGAGAVEIGGATLR